MNYTVINGLETDDIRYAELSKSIKSLFDGPERATNQITEWIDLGNESIKYCTGCDHCQTVNPGLCALNDSQNARLKSFISGDAVLMITPVRFGCCSSLLKNFIDRTEPLFMPLQIAKGKRSIMKGRYEKYPNLIVLGINDSGKDHEECFSKFIRHSNLAQVCPNTEVKVFSEEQQIEELRDFVFGGDH